METLEAEVIQPQSTALAVREPQAVAVAPLWGTDDQSAILAKATATANSLKDVVKSRGLISNISGREYPRCEAWTLLGSLLGVFPVLCWTKQVENGWEARVEAKTLSGSIVGAAEAQCCRNERNWNNRDDFALRSMAQTRATAKALRMPLGFIMTLAGYEACPSEEMEAYEAPKPKVRQQEFAGTKTTPSPASQPKTAHSTAGLPSEKEAKRIEALLEESKKKLIAGFKGNVVRQAWVYALRCGMLLPNEGLSSVNAHLFFPTAAKLVHYETATKAIKGDYDRLMSDIGQIEPTADEQRSFDAVHGAPGGSTEEPPQPKDVDSPNAQWRSFPVPFGASAGVLLGKLDKKKLFGFWANFEVEETYDGKPRPKDKITRDRQFRTALDDAGQHYKFTLPEDRGKNVEKAVGAMREAVEEPDSVPF